MSGTLQREEPRSANQTPLDPAELDRALMAEQAGFLFRTPVPMFVNLINAPITAAVVWRAYPAWLLMLWLALFLLIIPLRVLVWHRFRRERPPPGEAKRWAGRYLIGTGLTGCLWGLAGSIVFVSPETIYHLFVAFVLAGMCAGAVASQSVYLPALAAFMIPTLSPIAIAFLIAGNLVSIAMGLLALVFAAALALIGRGFNRALAETFRLQIENRALIRRLTEALDAAEAASHAKSQFLAQMSHELRTPLNAILGFSEMFMAEQFGALPSPKYLLYSRYMNESAGHLLELVKEILELSKAAAGTLVLEEEAVELRGVIETCVNMLEDRARAHGLLIERTLAADLPRLRADPAKLRRLLINLLSNAVKFTPPGGRVTIGAALEDSGALRLTVADSGIGMRPEDIPKALSPFVQLNQSFTRQHEGIGLGLPLAKHLAELHGATLEIDSAPGRGTTVGVRFPPERTLRGNGSPAAASSTARS